MAPSCAVFLDRTVARASKWLGATAFPWLWMYSGKASHVAPSCAVFLDRTVARSSKWLGATAFPWLWKHQSVAGTTVGTDCRHCGHWSVAGAAIWER